MNIIMTTRHTRCKVTVVCKLGVIKKRCWAKWAWISPTGMVWIITTLCSGWLNPKTHIVVNSHPLSRFFQWWRAADSAYDESVYFLLNDSLPFLLLILIVTFCSFTWSSSRCLVCRDFIIAIRSLLADDMAAGTEDETADWVDDDGTADVHVTNDDEVDTGVADGCKGTLERIWIESKTFS